MAGTQSFDITSGCDLQEVDNAVNQALKEIHQRYDFKGSKVEIDFPRAEKKLILRGPDDFKLRAVWEVLQQKLVRRQVPVRNLHPGKILPAAGGSVTQEIELQQGIPIETSRAIVKFVKEKKLKKVQVEIQADQVRVSSPSRDDLQSVMGLLRGEDFGIELKFGNYRSV
jgi:cyclic-di-GMP-binding protein